jgi:glycosyltransferase involved in cell wall biosynthesis
MTVEASLIIANFNREEQLVNTLAALATEVVFPELEVIVVDDYSKNDPQPVVEKILKDIGCNFKYCRFPENVGGRKARSLATALMEPSAKMILTLAADVIVISPGIIRKMLDTVAPGVLVMPEVKSIPVPIDIYRSIELYKDRLLESWEMYDGGPKIYQGPSRPDKKFYLFCAAALKEDLFHCGYENLSCDFWFDAQIRKNGLKPKFMEDLKAIHQMHRFVQHPCSEIGTCEFTPSCEKRGVQKLRSQYDLPG